MADPPGSVLYDFIRTGVVPATRTGSSITEGIGQGRVTANLEGAPIDEAIRIEDAESLRMTFDLVVDEVKKKKFESGECSRGEKKGIFVGCSSGLNVAAAVLVAKQLGPGSTVATILCDSGQRYQSRLFSRAWLQSKNLLQVLDERHLKLLSD